ncbi:hypothetical protein [Reinekea blandensis]|uniref:Uncharacterized protein n=1 Tax=Reinekea blandensis MED297 TaxID=314283 RepID=A4BJM2_9GAMM|nr:hypothetical protein [Reinekea blandensis]EAR07662.1 hypothetical protein MED297_06469 [Reinekea sp. MED297] [Reinekea blandensis MED297]
MNTINTQTVPYQQPLSSESAGNAVSEASAASTSETQTNSAESGSTVQVSSRAQAIQKLNEEFFSGGTRGFSITPAFIDRLQEYGLISNDEASALSSGTSAAATKDEPKALAMLSDQVTSLIDRLIEDDEDNALIEPLQNARDALDNIESLFSQGSEADFNSLKQALLVPQSTEAMEALSEAEVKTLNQLTMSLTIAQKLSSGSGNSGVIGEYLSNLS